LYRYRCPKCRTAYYSAARQEALKTCICYVCQHKVVYVEEDEAGKRASLHGGGSRRPKG
jgi:uncharacterized Zn finger protein (UPF0148 family)